MKSIHSNLVSDIAEVDTARTFATCYTTPGVSLNDASSASGSRITTDKKPSLQKQLPCPGAYLSAALFKLCSFIILG